MEAAGEGEVVWHGHSMQLQLKALCHLKRRWFVDGAVQEAFAPDCPENGKDGVASGHRSGPSILEAVREVLSRVGCLERLNRQSARGVSQQAVRYMARSKTAVFRPAPDVGAEEEALSRAREIGLEEGTDNTAFGYRGRPSGEFVLELDSGRWRMTR